MAHKRLEDANGNKSSKRLFGSLLTIIGIIMIIIAYSVSLFHPLGDPATVKDLCYMMVGSGTGLLGLGTLFERIGKSK